MKRHNSAAWRYAAPWVGDAHHRDGVPWYAAPLPCRWHLCRPQTQQITGLGELVQRCACGAIRPANRRRWSEKNTRRGQQ